ncbi:uncharacterized protein LOC106392731 [Brassica napus]|uniref:uncharacterized protein LOC106392731 n=1 Tax=Brassica napus TaxID=3708 RepID=UPI0006AA7990|nr:uncharacterized protein LOC106392731 [Brassica napus]
MAGVWKETPDEDYLKYLLVWVRIRNIPVNHYTAEAITALGDIIGRVDVFAFDPDKPQTNAYVRVRVFFDVSRHVRRSKVVNRPKGGGSERQVKAKDWRKKVKEENQREEEGKQTFMVTIEKDDPLYGVLNDDQVGVDKATGQRKINHEVLQQMREYILAAEGGEKRVRQERVRKSVSDLDNDPLGQKKFLRLEAAPPIITHEVDKGKGFVFGYSKQNEPNHSLDNASRGSSSWVEKENVSLLSDSVDRVGDRASNSAEKGNNFFFDYSTGFSSGFFCC